MPAVSHFPELEDDIASVVQKYPSIRDELEYVSNLIRRGVRIGGVRLREFNPDLVYRFDVTITDLGPRGEDRCSLIYELDGNDCYFINAL